VTVIPPQPTAQAPAPAPALTLADVTTAVTNAIKPLTDRIQTLEGLRGAGVSPTAWGNQPPVPNPTGNIDAPRNEAEVRAACDKAKTFSERREILAKAREAGLKV